ncbi:MAG: AAA family ATPase, partial [Bryobacteraceae bacterium]|nr:AAA family ATPase [Bryobacteraceae bacterium]
MSDWKIFQGNGIPDNRLTALPLPPPWRKSSVQLKPILPAKPPYDLEAEKGRGAPLQINEEVKRAVNAALFLRRPLLLTGKPGVGKSSLVSAVAYELRMGPVLRWAITSRSTVRSGLYEYDAVGRLQAKDNKEEKTGIGEFLRLGPLGTALFPSDWPRALLIDEIDKGDIDLPNDLLNILEEGKFEIPELVRSNEPSVEIRAYDEGL